MKEFMYELNRLRTDIVPADELENAKRAIIGSFALSLEQPQSLLQNIITQKLTIFPLTTGILIRRRLRRSLLKTCNEWRRSTSTWATCKWLRSAMRRKRARS